MKQNIYQIPTFFTCFTPRRTKWQWQRKLYWRQAGARFQPCSAVQPNCRIRVQFTWAGAVTVCQKSSLTSIRDIQSREPLDLTLHCTGLYPLHCSLQCGKCPLNGHSLYLEPLGQAILDGEIVNIFFQILSLFTRLSKFFKFELVAWKSCVLCHQYMWQRVFKASL